MEKSKMKEQPQPSGASARRASVQEVAKKKKRFSLSPTRLLLYLAAFIFLIYSAVTIISQSISIADKKARLIEVNEEITHQEYAIDAMKEALNYNSEEEKEYIEQIARQELDYIRNGERVFVNVSGD